MLALRCLSSRRGEKNEGVVCLDKDGRGTKAWLWGGIRTRSIATQRNELNPPADWAFSGDFSCSELSCETARLLLGQWSTTASCLPGRPAQRTRESAFNLGARTECRKDDRIWTSDDVPPGNAGSTGNTLSFCVLGEGSAGDERSVGRERRCLRVPHYLLRSESGVGTPAFFSARNAVFSRE